MLTIYPKRVHRKCHIGRTVLRTIHPDNTYISIQQCKLTNKCSRVMATANQSYMHNTHISKLVNWHLTHDILLSLANTRCRWQIAQIKSFHTLAWYHAYIRVLYTCIHVFIHNTPKCINIFSAAVKAEINVPSNKACAVCQDIGFTVIQLHLYSNIF